MELQNQEDDYRIGPSQTKRGRVLGTIHSIVGAILFIGSSASAFELNYGFIAFSCFGIMYIVFGLICIYSTWKSDPYLFHHFFVWCKSSIVFNAILTIIMATQFYYEFYGNLHCTGALLGVCISLQFLFSFIPLVASVVGVILFPSDVAEDKRLYFSPLELEDLIIPGPQPTEIDPIRRAVIKFNNGSANQAIQFLIDEQAITGKGIEIANFLFMESNLNMAKVGDYIGEFKPLNLEVLKHFTECYDFTGMDFDQAIRHFLSRFRLPGEAQKIDRIMEAFAARYCRNNPGVFPSPDTAYVLAFSLIMLNTDAHNPAITKKMSLNAFLANNRGIAGGKDLPASFLEKLYNNIINEEIKIEGDTIFTKASKKGYLLKRGRRGIKSRWQRRYFVVSNNCLFYFATAEDHKPTAIIPLEGLCIVKNSYPSHPYCFELYDPSQSKIKSVKLTQKDTKEGGHETFLVACETEREQDQWIASIKNNMVDNPVMQLINQKKSQMDQIEQMRQSENL